MIEQEQAVQEKKDEVVSEEVKPEVTKEFIEEIADHLQIFVMRFFGDPKQKGQMVYNAAILFVIGLFFSFAPIYMQTTIAWVENASAMLFFICLMASFCYINTAYPNVIRNFEMGMAICLLCAIGFYIFSSAPGSKQHYIDPLDRVSYRGLSFFLLLMAVMIVLMRIPDYISFYSKHKGKIKAFFNVKHTAALILGILSVGTALFQFIQLVLQIFHP